MQKPIVPLAVLALAGCAPAGGGDPEPEPTPDERCLGDAIEEDVPYSEDIPTAMAERWDLNQELVRILFVGEPL